MPALEAHLSHFNPARLEVPAALSALPAAVETAAYRIITEAVHNVVQHAGGATVGGGVAGIGLHSMRERAEELGGSLTISEGQGGVGTFVRAVLPYAGPALVTDPIASGSMA